MSNLYKQRCVTTEESNKRVINSNQMVEQKLAQLQRAYLAQQSNSSPEDGFTSGIVATEVAIEELEESEPDYIVEAREEAERILADARYQAEQMIADANGQVDAIVQQARQEGQRQGYEEGSEAAKQELLQEQQEYDNRRELLEAQYQEQLDQLEPQLLDVILQVVDKVFGIQFADKKEILLHLIRKTLTGIESCRQFQLRAGQDNYLFLETHKDEIINAIGGGVTISVMADATIEDDRCLIETDSGMYDCSIDVELQNLIKDIRSLCL